MAKFKLPALKNSSLVLMLVILVAAFAVAALLIWAGIKLSPIGEKGLQPVANQETSNSNLNKKTRKGIFTEEVSSWSRDDYGSYDASGEESVGSRLNNSNSNLYEETYRAKEINTEPAYSEQTDSSQLNLNINSADGSDVSESPAVTNDNVDSRQTGQTGSAAGTTIKVPKYDPTIWGDCTHPEGDPNSWWPTATPKQKGCYVNQHGWPKLKNYPPYFCDYDKSEDCFYK